MIYGFGWGWMLLVLIIIISLAVWLVRVMFPQGGSTGTPTEDDPLDIARHRYARGEIDREEFENIRRELS